MRRRGARRLPPPETVTAFAVVDSDEACHETGNQTDNRRSVRMRPPIGQPLATPSTTCEPGEAQGAKKFVKNSSRRM
jgi:hypothetical protein